MKVYSITVKRIEELEYLDLKDQEEFGEDEFSFYEIEAKDEKEALDEFHASISIAKPGDFEVYAQELKADKLMDKVNRNQKQTTSIRIYQSDKDQIILRYGTVQKFIDYIIEREFYN